MHFHYSIKYTINLQFDNGKGSSKDLKMSLSGLDRKRKTADSDSVFSTSPLTHLCWYMFVFFNKTTLTSSQLMQMEHVSYHLFSKDLQVSRTALWCRTKINHFFQSQNKKHNFVKRCCYIFSICFLPFL